MSNEQLHITQIISPSKIAGAERSTLRLIHELSARGHRVTLVCKQGFELIDVARSEGIDVHAVRMQGKLNAAAPFRLASFLRRRRVDVIATQLSTASLWGSIAGRMLNVPVVATVRALNTKTCYTLADRVITVSDAVRQHLVAQGMPASRIERVYNGIDLDRFQPVADSCKAKQAAGIATDRIVLGVVAHLTPKKGHAWFLESAAPLLRREPKCIAMFLGEGGEREAIVAAARRLGIANQLLMPGFKNDVRPWIAAMDVVALPTIAKEGFGRVLVEAGAMEKPVITSQIGGVVEVVQHDVTGFSVPTGDRGLLTGALEKLVRDSDLRTRMGSAGRRRAEQRFSVQLTAANTEAVYRQALEHRQALRRAA